MERFGNLKIFRLTDLPQIPEEKPLPTKKAVSKKKVSKAKPKPNAKAKGKRGRKRRPHKDADFSEDELLYINSSPDSDSDLPDDFKKSLPEPDEEEAEPEIAMFGGVTGVDEILYGEVEYNQDSDNLHPAEVAARYQSSQKGPLEVTDGQILKDLRKSVFSVPLLHQEDVSKYFNQIDDCVFPTVYSILETSMVYFEDVIQVVMKVAAGNTYGKNIYTKNNVEEPKTKGRGTYKEHETRFLKNAYNLFRLYATHSTKAAHPGYKLENISIRQTMISSEFIRGVYEDILEDFVHYTNHYEDLHWLALSAKLNDEHEEYHRLTNVLILLDSKLKLNKSSYYIARESQTIHKKYMQIRSSIITPYLRSVYSTAKKTARNPHQMLDNFQNGSMGLMRAVSCYDVKRLASFASVAKSWIKQMMLLSIKEDANFVKLPVSTWQAYTQLEKARVKINADRGSDADLEAIAKEAGMPLKKVKSVYHTVKISQVYSLNRTYDSEEKLTLEDIMTNEDRLGGEEDVFVEQLREYCGDADLTDKEIKVLALRHGMVDLIRNKKMIHQEVYQETMKQNLGCLGYHYKIRA